MMSKKRIRKVMQGKRASLSDNQLNEAAKNLTKHALKMPAILAAKNIASYLPLNGEMPTKLLPKAFPNANFFLPRISCFHRSSMQFYSANNALVKNKFNILEPIPSQASKPISEFDIVLLPLVAFDDNGNRLGMGGGFYDRALAFRKQRRFIKRPLLIGLAHHFQQVSSITPENWDIPLDAILTDQELIKIS